MGNIKEAKCEGCGKLLIMRIVEERRTYCTHCNGVKNHKEIPSLTGSEGKAEE